MGHLVEGFIELSVELNRLRQPDRAHRGIAEVVAGDDLGRYRWGGALDSDARARLSGQPGRVCERGPCRDQSHDRDPARRRSVGNHHEVADTRK